MDGVISSRRFTRPVFLWPVTALVLDMAVDWFNHRWPSPQARFLTLLPLVPMMLFLVALSRAILRMDEMQKRICLESIAVAFVLTLALTLIFIGLERANVYKAHWDDLGSDMMFFWACAYVFSVWRYR
jgi:hypothetical protein